MLSTMQSFHGWDEKKKKDIPLSVLRLTKQSPLGKELKLAKGEHGFMWKHTLHTKM